VARRTVLDAEEPMPVVLALDRTAGSSRWELATVTLRSALPAGLAAERVLRVEVAHVDLERVLLAVFPDVTADARLPLPTFGPLGALAPAHDRSVTLALDLTDGSPLSAVSGPSPVGREGSDREALISDLRAVGLDVDDALATSVGTWVLVGDVVARLGG